MKIRTLVFVLLLGISARGNAGYYSAGDMLFFCESESITENSLCYAYLAGIVDAHDSLRKWDLLKEINFCIPAGVKQVQLKKVFVKYANERPESLHLDAGAMALNAFAGAFPCK